VSSLAGRLTALFGLIVLGGLLVVYAGVVPFLDGSLRDQELRELRQAGERHAGRVADLVGTNASDAQLSLAVRDAADRAGARVTLVRFSRGTAGLQGYVQNDSSQEPGQGGLRFDIADEAARTGEAQTGTQAGDDGRVAQAALPLATRRGDQAVVGSVLVFSRPLGAIEAQVALVERRLLAAGAVALVLALLLGALTAQRMLARVRRLEGTARRVAAGDFSARFDAGGEDELARLAAALDDMHRQLAELDEARKRFIAVASHELRTPLFSLRGFVELLESDELDDDERAEALVQLREGVDRLSRLATDLLDLSRLESGALELRPEPTDVGVLARAVAAEFQPMLSRRDAHLEVRLGSGDGRVHAVCDPERVAQVMRILIDNALRHSPPGTDVVMSASRRDGRLRLAVTDYGPGIRRTQLAHVFEPFFTSDAARGSGLGLAIARELAERMAGDLRVDSAPGRTTFALELPARE
jgi:two-component system, OmpR family, sensor kinase